MGKYDRHINGRGSRVSPGLEALKWEWDAADKLNAEHPGQGEWVPRRTIFVDDSISPRSEANVDDVLVSHYANIFSLLPPIRVQKDTFRLIDGKHRLRASFESAASTEHIRIVEVEVPDDELWLAAFDANAEHGRALKTDERVAFAKKLMKAFPGWSDAKVAERAGVSRNTVMKYRPSAKDPNAPVTREGRDGKVYQVAQNEHPEGRSESERAPRIPVTVPVRSPISTFEPDPEPVYEERDDVDRETGELLDTGAGSDGTPAVAPPPDQWDRYKKINGDPLGFMPQERAYFEYLKAAAESLDEVATGARRKAPEVFAHFDAVLRIQAEQAQLAVGA